MPETIPHLAAEWLQRALAYPELMNALRTGFASATVAPRRHAHHPTPTSTLLLMPAWQERHAGIKMVSVVPENRQRGLPTVQALYVLLDTASGTPLALMDGDTLTVRRTAAVSALASCWLSRPDSRRLLVVGTGRLAPELAVAHCAARAIDHVTVWGRDPTRALAATARIRECGLDAGIRVEVAQDLQQACADADIICCATTSTQPLLRAHHIQPGTHVDLTGGFRPDMREADDALMASASLFVDTLDGALAEAGDLVQPLNAGLISPSSVRAELAALARGEHAGRTRPTEITLFKSVGTAVSDLSAAARAWDHYLCGLTDSLPDADYPARG